MGLYAAVLLLTPVVLVGTYLWGTGEVRLGFDAAGLQPVPPARRPEPVRVLPDYTSVDLDEQRLLVQGAVEKLRAQADVPVAALGAALLRWGDLERAVGTLEAGAAAFREVISLEAGQDNWQV